MKNGRSAWFTGSPEGKAVKTEPSVDAKEGRNAVQGASAEMVPSLEKPEWGTGGGGPQKILFQRVGVCTGPTAHVRNWCEADLA